jgi:acyl transferase domain-containing protein/acyl-CoA synthetase (AMP-forming)/AMP-acid ligase II/acetylornithine/succinyldiaminopimelate/putrescine aminotransferase/predicted amino acid dehydrogenase
MVTSSSLAPDCATLVELLRYRACQTPDRLAFSFLTDSETVKETISYGELDRRARALAAALQSRGLSGERALLLCPPGFDYVAAFFGCLYAGVVAVPTLPPRRDHGLDRLQAIVADAQPAAVVALSGFAAVPGRDERLQLGGLHWVILDEEAGASAPPWREPALRGDDLAMLQYTSGSTTTPRGVMLTHSNLLHNAHGIARKFEHTPDRCGVIWLPPYHDMGLVGGVIQPVFAGFPCYLMSPATVVRNPLTWLRAISRFRGTDSGGPNFAYELCLRKITPEQRAGLDLSCWQVAFTGAEPVRAETLARFAAAFGPQGFRRQAFYPCYGLAEATLLVTGGRVGEPPVMLSIDKVAVETNKVLPAPLSRVLVCCGRSLEDQQVLVVHPENLTAQPPDEIGEIWVAGPSVARGYWGRPDLTADTFGARLADPRGEPSGSPTDAGPFLRTGDLGFLHAGELFVTGRLKDLIVFAGQNHWPEDLEATATQASPFFLASAAFEAPSGDGVVIVQEVARRVPQDDLPELAARVRQVVVEQHQVAVRSVVLLRASSLPRTSSGKLQRHVCRDRFAEGLPGELYRWQASPREAAAPLRASGPAEAAAIESWLRRRIAGLLGVPEEKIDRHQPFSSYGLDSGQGVALAAELEAWLGWELSPTLVWSHPTLAELTRRLAAGQEIPARDVSSSGPIAIIGLAGRFPGSLDLDGFAALLEQGKSAITEFPPDRPALWASYDPDPQAPGKTYSKWGGFLTGLDQFDPLFFRVSPREALVMDPQQRLLLEVAWEALESAGYAGDRLAGSSTGVFVGGSEGHYAHRYLTMPERLEGLCGTGGAGALLSNRLSYLLDLHGPSLTLDTACSSSLVALHLAVESLRRGECSAALVGGVNALLSREPFIIFSKARMLSPDGRCKTFSANADGYVRSEGAVALLLKPLDHALRDGDNVLAVLRGTAVNQDGRTNGLSAPNPAAQVAVLRRCYESAGIDPATVTLVETHGTGTLLGDQIEWEALNTVFAGARPQSCALGAPKALVGHLEYAAGLVGVASAVLALTRRRLPASLCFNAPSSRLDFANSPFYASDRPRPWVSHPAVSCPGSARFPRRAGVSAFGFGGTNAHVVLEEAQAPTPRAPAPAPEAILCLSARTEAGLRTLAQRFAGHLRQTPDLDLHDVCHSANGGRPLWPHRLALLATSTSELAADLAAFAAEAPLCRPNWSGVVRNSPPPLLREELASTLKEASGESGEWVRVLTSLGENFARGTHFDWSIVAEGRAWRRVALPPSPLERQRYWIDDRPISQAVEADVEQELDLKRQPLLRAHEVHGRAIVPAAFWIDLALAAGGALQDVRFPHPLILPTDRPARVRLTRDNGGESVGFRALSAAPGGAWMEHCTGKRANPPAERPAKVDVAALAARLSGEVDQSAFYDAFRQLGLAYGEELRSVRRLQFAGAEGLANLETAPGGGDGSSLHPALVDGALQALGALGFLAAGTRPTSLYLPLQIAEVSVFGSLRGRALCRLRIAGSGMAPGNEIQGDAQFIADDGEVLAELRSVVLRRLPGQSHVVATENTENTEKNESTFSSVSSVSSVANLRDWFCTFAPEQVPAPARRAIPIGTWALFGDGEVVEDLARRLREVGCRCVRVQAGNRYRELSPDLVQVATENPEDYRRLVGALAADVQFCGVIHLGACAPPSGVTLEALEKALAEGVLSAFLLAQALLTVPRSALELWLVGATANGLTDAVAAPSAGALWGFARVLAREAPQLRCRSVDLSMSATGAQELWSELQSDDREVEVAYKGGHRCAPRWRPLGENTPASALPPADGVYLVTGGQGGVGLELARALAERGRPTLVLLNRTPLPEVDELKGALPSDDERARRLRGVHELRQSCAAVWPVAGDVADLAAMTDLVRRIRERYGRLNGVIHAAGVLRDRTVPLLDRQAFREVMRPKVLGAWALHLATTGVPLDCFVLCSSVAAQVGNPGQANYAAANSFLDALAHTRRSQGLSALSINWGFWGETGMAADERWHGWMAAAGVLPISNRDGRRAFLAALASGRTQVAIVHRTPQKTAGDQISSTSLAELQQHARDFLVVEVARALHLSPADIDPQTNFMELGFDSLLALQVQQAVETAADITLPPTVLFEHPSIEHLSAHLSQAHSEAVRRHLGQAHTLATENTENTEKNENIFSSVSSVTSVANSPAFGGKTGHEDLAVIGLACRFPGATTPEQFWDNLRAGRVQLGDPPADRGDWGSGVRGGYLANVWDFDATFFGLSAEEARQMDPQQRLLLEVAWEAVERAGLHPAQLRGQRVGVFVAAATQDHIHLLQASGLPPGPRQLSGNALSLLANRISYLFDFTAPSLTIDTACSSALVALHLAAQSIRAGDSDLALVAGVNLILRPDNTRTMREAGLLSPDGVCRAFDASASGYARSEGVAAVLLQPRPAAERAGAPVWALVKGVAVNHDGHRKAGLVAASPAGIAAVVGKAYRDAGISPASVSYVEAHGTGTLLGDALEVVGLTDAFRPFGVPPGTCGLGSVKALLGHGEASAGLASLFSAILALRHGVVAPTLEVFRPNPHASLEGSPFFLADRLRPWPTTARFPRRAGVNGFGLGGTNAHVILEAPPEPTTPSPQRALSVLALAAPSEAGLRRLVNRYQLALEVEDNVADLCATATAACQPEAYRTTLVFRGRDHLSDKLLLLHHFWGDWARLRPSAIFYSGPERSGNELARRLAALPGGARQAFRRCCKAAPPGMSLPFENGLTKEQPLDERSTQALFEALAECFIAGGVVDWASLEDGRPRRRAPLPTYPFERSTYRVDFDAPPVPPEDQTANGAEMRAELAPLWKQALQIEEVDPDESFFQLGGTSLRALDLQANLRERFGVDVEVADLFAHNTLRSLAQLIAERRRTLASPRSSSSPLRGPVRAGAEERMRAEPLPARSASKKSSAPDSAVAVIGMAGRFPGAKDLATFWRNLRAGFDAVRQMAPRRRDGIRHVDADRVHWGGFLDNPELFDPHFFRLSPREARWIDPQQRLLLEVAWEALEHAGHAGQGLTQHRCGVFVGASYTHRRDELLEGVRELPDAQTALGNQNALLANRVSYFLGLRGPSLTVDTLCSSSLVALHLAVASLRRGECDYALVAGVHVGMSSLYYHALSQLQVLAPEGRCRAFARGAEGYVPGEAVAAVLLTRLDRARQEGDNVLGVVRGSAVNHGGRAAGLTVPNPTAQAEVVAEALADAGLRADQLGYVEAHGTGTALGDPIEVAGLAQAFRASASQFPGRQRCGIGSLKSNVGHLEPAAGIGGLIKVLLALQARELPPTLHLTEVAPSIVFEDSPFYLVDRLRPWEANGEPRRAGVSSFGLGGVNAHVIVEEAPPVFQSPAPTRPGHLLVLSARSDAALKRLAAAYREHLADHGEQELTDTCFTSALGRAHLPHRLAVLAGGREELLLRLGPAYSGPGVWRGVAGSARAESVSPNGTPDGGMSAAARRFVAGDEVDWAKVIGPGRRVPLPTYPFERISCEPDWPVQTADERPARSPAEQVRPLLPEAGRPGIRLLRPVWQPSPTPPGEAPVGRRWLLLCDTAGVGAALAKRLRSGGSSVIEVRPGLRFRRVGPERLEIHPDQIEDYERLQKALHEAGWAPDEVVHLWGWASDVGSPVASEDLDASVGDSFLSLVHLVRVFRAGGEALRSLRIFTAESQQARPTDGCLQPQAALAWGLARVLALEYPALRVQCVDFPEALAPEEAATLAARELSVPVREAEVAWRDGQRFAPGAEAVEEQSDQRPCPLRPDGAYLITGGLGGLGLALARWLARRGRARIALVSRQPLPDRARWSSWQVEHPEDWRTRDRIQAVLELEALGAEVEVLGADVADLGAMRRTVEGVRERWGRLDAVFHAAGVLRDGLLEGKTVASMYEVLRPKVHGAWVLDQICDDSFLVLFSSVVGWVGNAGQADYAAGNRYLDSFAVWRTGRGRLTLSVAWGPWAGVGMAAGLRETVRARGLELLAPEEALAALGRVLTLNLPQVSVVAVGSKSKPAPGLRRWTAHDVEAALVRRLAALLEVDPSQLGPGVRFQELGIDSISGVQFLGELARRLGVSLPPALLFDYPDVGSFSAYLFGKMSDEQANALLSGEPQECLEPQPPHTPAPVDVHLPSAEAGSFAQYSRPLLMERLAALGLDRAFVRAQGDYLFYRRGEEEVRVLDLVGGYGSTLFGHNHHDLVARARAILDANVPIHVQGSDRRFSGELARELSLRVGEYTGRSYVTTFASTGAEVIEVAIKHAQLEFQAHVEQHRLQGIKVFARLLHSQGRATLAPGLRTQLAAIGITADDLETAHAALVKHNASVRNARPAFLALRQAFHGKTSGAVLLSYNPDFRLGNEEGAGLRVVRVDTENLHGLREAVARETHLLTELAESESGEAVLVRKPWCLVAAVFVEPVQGEGGVRPLSPELLAELRFLADQHGFPVVVDEVQSGMGRCGAFTAAEAAGLRGDYYALGKSLGGGLAKIAALLIDRTRYVPALGVLHTSTFADDDSSALIALRALEILTRDGLIARAAARGASLLARLRELARTFPEVIADVRGRGCLLGLELADPCSSPSALLRQAGPQLGMLAASYLFAEHDLRLLPTSSAPNTLRLEPSAYLADADVEHCLAALTQLCTIIRNANAGRLLRHLVCPEERTPLGPAADYCNQPALPQDEPAPGEPRVAFLTYFVETADLAWWDPSLAEIPRERHEEIIRGLSRVSAARTFARARVRSATGRSVLVELVGFMINSEMLEQGVREDNLGWLLEQIDEAVESAVKRGASAVGFAGYLSILTHNALRAARPDVALTTGNALTVATGLELVRAGCRQRGIDLGVARVGVVGAYGNIASTYVRSVAEEATAILLVGRPRSQARLHELAALLVEDAWERITSAPEQQLSGLSRALARTEAVRRRRHEDGTGPALYQQLLAEMGDDFPVRVADDLGQLTACQVIFSASSSARPLIYPEHLAPGPVVLCDIAVPPDVAPEVARRRPDVLVISGGAVRLPLDQAPGLCGRHLPPDAVFSCLGETILLGLSDWKGHFSFGPIRREDVQTIAGLAREHGFTPRPIEK